MRGLAQRGLQLVLIIAEFLLAPRVVLYAGCEAKSKKCCSFCCQLLSALMSNWLDRLWTGWRCCWRLVASCSLAQDGRIKLLELLEHIEEGSRVKEVPFQMKLSDTVATISYQLSNVSLFWALWELTLLCRFVWWQVQMLRLNQVQLSIRVFWAYEAIYAFSMNI